MLKTVGYTSCCESYVLVEELPEDHRFFAHLKTINLSDENVASHLVIEKHIDKLGKDYRYEDKPHPIKELQNRKKDNTCVGKV